MLHFVVTVLEVKWQPRVLPLTMVSDSPWMSHLKSAVKHQLTYQQPQEVKRKEYKGVNLIARVIHTYPEATIFGKARQIGKPGSFCLLKATQL